jgi:hypothetical protein
MRQMTPAWLDLTATNKIRAVGIGLRSRLVRTLEALAAVACLAGKRSATRPDFNNQSLRGPIVLAT